MKDFLNSIRDAHDTTEDPEARKAIQQVMKFRDESASAIDRVCLDAENIEDLFSLADMQEERTELSISLAIGETLNMAARKAGSPTLKMFFPKGAIPRCWSNAYEVSPDPEDLSNYDPNSSTVRQIHRYEAYLASMIGLTSSKYNPANTTIITFNYDCLLEAAATSLGVKLSYRIPQDWIAPDSKCTFHADEDDLGVTLLKLHGSINWSIGSRTPVDYTTNNRTTVPILNIYDSYDLLRKDEKIPHLMPPTWRKSPHPVLSRIWEEAVKAIRSATRIAVIGYSMPTSDDYFRFLLASGLRNNISLRKIHFVNLSYGSWSDDPVFGRAQSLIQKSMWDRHRATFSQAGTHDFCMRELDTSDWGREVNDPTES